MSTDQKLPFGTNYCKCSVCGAYFGGERAFDMHRVGSMGDRRCLTPSGMKNRGFYLNSRGYWSRQYGQPDPQCLTADPQAERTLTYAGGVR